MLLAGTIPLFLGVLLSDIAYSRTYEIQWKNFASWLIVGGLVFAGFALLWAVVRLVRVRPPRARTVINFVLLLAIWVLGFINALIHAADAWASMPAGLVVSAIVAVLAIGVAAIGLFSSHSEAAE
jgi:uncharacterized membrane protein